MTAICPSSLSVPKGLSVRLAEGPGPVAHAVAVAGSPRSYRLQLDITRHSQDRSPQPMC